MNLLGLNVSSVLNLNTKWCQHLNTFTTLSFKNILGYIEQTTNTMEKSGINVNVYYFRSVIEDNAGWPQNYNADQIASVTRGGSLPRPPSIIP